MSSKPPLNFSSGLSLLRRLWFVPIVAAIAGVGLGAGIGGGNGTTVAETRVSLLTDPAFELLRQPDTMPKTDIGRPISVLAAAIDGDEAKSALGDSVRDTKLDISVTDTTLIMRVSGASKSRVQRATSAYVDLLRKYRLDDFAQASSAVQVAIQTGRKVLQDYLADPNGKGTVQAGGTLVTNEADAATKLAEYAVLGATAKRLSQVTEPISFSTSIVSATSFVVSSLLLGFVFLALGVVIVLVVGPLLGGVRTLQDVTAAIGGQRVLAVAGRGSAELLPLALAIRHASAESDKVALLPMRDSSVAAQASEIEMHLRSFGDERTVLGVAPLPGGLDQLVREGAGAIVMVRSGKARASAISHAVLVLQNAGVPIIGVALVEVSASDMGSAG
jgi:hypothetical protein